jgi:hypothetical protein
MNDPRRWADEEGDATEIERDLIRAARAAGPSSDEQKQIWLGIAAQCVPPAAGVGTGAAATAAAAPAKGSGLWALVSLKTVVVVAAVGGGAITGYGLTHHSRPPAAPPVQTANAPVLVPAELASPTADPNAPSAAEPGALPGPTAVRTNAPAPDDAKKSRASRLAEESRVVLDARNALRSGNLGGALRMLDAARTAFPDGALTQEREALTIEALARSGQRELASRRGGAFLRDYPNSPHASDVKHYIVLP